MPRYMTKKAAKDLTPYLPGMAPKTTKYGNMKCEIDGLKFHSLLEGRYYQQLKKRQAAGDIKFFLRQVPFDLPGPSKYLMDFVVFCSDGSIEYTEIKGCMTQLAALKLKQTMQIYGITIDIIREV